ncbi:hypothetical protein EG68_04981 [Paragonimus skrjabini miyazakii]|uniref:Uncharacterized protein n=1 Tax=Paragonimus skrjabini miyazakii TaxID=59628 RepID=A0A8S9Z1Y7_9TREM|nr:hypothetical protein EG68_04981 [Paragonimus skrjabini miyazakii]
MDYGNNNKTEGLSLTPLTSRGLVAYSTIGANSGLENTSSFPQTAPSDSLRIAIELFNNFASNSNNEGSAPCDKINRVGSATVTNINNNNSVPSSFVSEPSATDLQALAQHLLTLANCSPTTSHSSGFVGSSVMPSSSDNGDRWNNYPNSSTSPTGHSSPAFTDGINLMDISHRTLSNLNDVNTLNQLALLTKAWPASSPAAMVAFQNALAQLALLGLSPTLPSTTTPEVRPSPTITKDSMNAILSSAQPKPYAASPIDGEKATQHTVNETSVGHHAEQNKSESGSKVIIRQTADADEHFFKALRRLKVDASPESQAVELKNFSTSLRTSMEHANLKPAFRTGPEPSGTSNSFGTKRSEAEKAVDEHFEKSLAAFPGFSALKKTVADTIPSTMTTLALRTPGQSHILTTTSMMYSTTEQSTVSKSLIQKTARPNALVTHIQTESHSQRNSFMSFSPSDFKNSTSLTHIPQPPPYRREHPPFHSDLFTTQPCHHETNDLRIKSSGQFKQDPSHIRLPAPVTALSDNRCIRPKLTPSVNNPIPITPTAVPVNSFKPKKNWLAQYGGKEARSEDTGTISPISPSATQLSGFDSLGSSPSSLAMGTEVGEESTHGDTVNEMKQLSPVPITRMFNETSLAMHTGPAVIPEPIMMKGTTNVRSDTEQQLADLAPVEQLGEDNVGECVDFMIQKNTSSPSPVFVHSSDQLTSGFQDNPWKSDISEECLSVTLKDSATSPFPVNNADDETMDLDDEDSFKSNERLEITEKSHTDLRMSHTREESKSVLNWGLSSSSSPSPAPGEGSANFAITPVSGTTSGFFSGSTYSLDSSLSQVQPMTTGNRELDGSIDVKLASSTIEERNFSDRKSQTLAETSVKADPVEHSNSLWGLRKRASTDVSPWSTLKRSRSVLTSPLSYHENCPSLSPSPHDLLDKADDGDGEDDSLSAPDDRYAPEFSCRSAEASVRPLTPDLPDLQITKHTTHTHRKTDLNLRGEAISKNRESRLPLFYPIYTHATCEHKANSEPSTLSGKTGLVTIGRSLSDQSPLSGLHLKRDSNVFVLR